MKWKSDKEIYESIGRFNVDFEQVCRSMETCIRTILHGQGLTNESIQEILLAGYTAEPLRSLLQNLIGQTVVEINEEEKICSKIFGYLQDLIKQRNDLIHSKLYVIGMSKEEKEKEVLAIGEKLHANRKGVATKNIKLKKPELEDLIKQCKEASIMMSLLTRCVMGVRNLRECFKVEKKQLVIKYEALKPIPI